MPSPRPQAVVVLGMHRSGTSAVTRLLALGGAHLGPTDAVAGEGPDNPTGFWEHRGVRRIDDELLARLGGSWFEPPLPPRGWAGDGRCEDLAEEARALLERDFGDAPLQVWKDPRASLTLPFWRRLRPDLGVVLCVRNPLSVAASLAKRTHIEHRAAVALWAEYTASALVHSSGLPVAVVHYEDLLLNWRDVYHRIVGRLGLQGMAPAASIAGRVGEFLTPDLAHHRHTLADVQADPDTCLPASALYTLLRRAALWPQEEWLRTVTALAAHALGDRRARSRPHREGGPAYDVIVFANIDWSFRYQRPQQLASQFARHGHRVFYVVASDVLTSSPAGSYEATPVAERVLEVRLAGPHAVGAARYQGALDEPTCDAFALALEHLARDYDVQDALLQVQLPSWEPLARRLAERGDWTLSYDCMDEWEGFPLIAPELLDAERALVDASAFVSVTADRLLTKWGGRGARCVLVRNGVDFRFFSHHCVPNERLPRDDRPTVGFYGALAEWVDFGLLASVAAARPGWRFVLVGDVFVDDLEGLDELPNVVLVGRRPYEQMPEYLYHFDVCVIPFRITPMTHAVNPVKLYEFLSVGRPVVSVPLEELSVYADVLRFATTPDGFVQQIEAALGETDPGLVQARVRLAMGNDWSDRYRALHEAVVASRPLVSIVVITYGNLALTRDCLASLLERTTHPHVEIVVVDNASSDGTPDELRGFEAAHDHVRVILNESNRGFAAACNQGLEAARGELLVLLNNDTVVPRGWLSPLIAHGSRPDVGLVGPCTNFAGNEARVDVPYGDDLSGMQAFATRHMAEHAGECFDITVPAMFCVLMRRDVYEAVGPLDEAYGVGLFEDDDYAMRVRAVGLRTVCAEDAFVHHVGQAAFKELLKTDEYQAVWDRNQAHYESKWGAWTAHKPRDPSPGAPAAGDA